MASVVIQPCIAWMSMALLQGPIYGIAVQQSIHAYTLTGGRMRS